MANKETRTFPDSFAPMPAEMVMLPPMFPVPAATDTSPPASTAAPAVNAMLPLATLAAPVARFKFPEVVEERPTDLRKTKKMSAMVKGNVRTRKMWA